MHLATVVQALWYANTAATLFLLVRLRFSGLARVYRWFWWYLLVSFAEAAVRIPMQHRDTLSANVYMTAQFAGVVISVFLVMELYRLALAAHPAIARFGQQMVGYLLGAACLAAGASLLVLPILGPGRSMVLYYFLAFERTADSAVLLFLLLASAFMLWFPVRISQNVAVFIGGFVTYFVTHWAALLAVGMRNAWVDGLNVGMLALSLVCLIGWTVLLRPQGEATPVVTGRRWNAADMERLSGQLTAINAKLEGFSGKSRYISLQS
jgi:hypothetical protein